ncbi:MAG: cytochrome P450 [Acidimicrobiales bacterium]
MEPDRSLALDDIRLGYRDFWQLPLEVREGAFETLRRERPIAFMEEDPLEEFPQWPEGPGFYAVTRHADILTASKAPELFSSAKGITLQDGPEEFQEIANEFFNSMIGMDDPRHARLRKIVAGGFTPRMLAKVEADVQASADRIIDRIRSKGSCDFVTEVAARLPLEIICDMMAVPPERYDDVFDASNIILGGNDPEFAPPEGTDPIAHGFGAAMTLVNIMNETVEARRGKEGDDLTTTMVNAEVDGERLTDAEIASFFILLCVAGNETTRNAIGWGLHYLSEHPDQRRIWQNDFDEVAPTAVEEIVRLSSPVIYMRRTVTRDGVQLGDVVLNENDKIGMFYWSANRDEDVFDDPYRFDVKRRPNDQLGFGGPGPHFCLGAHLARREITVMFRELFDVVPDIEATGPPDRLWNSFINGVKHLPCEFSPA